MSSNALSKAEQNALSVSYDVLGTRVELDLQFVKRYLVRGDPTKITDQEIVFFMNTCKMHMITTGRYAAELWKMSRKDFWKMLNETMMVYYPHLESEFAALSRANDLMTKPNEETIYVAKVIILMWTQRENGDDYFALPNMDLWSPFRLDEITVPKPVDQCAKVNGLFPEWAYNWHTTYGKYTLRRDAVHAIENDQRLLTPLEVNLYDNCSWNRDINACLKKHNPRNYKLPFDDRKPTVEQVYGTQN